MKTRTFSIEVLESRIAPATFTVVSNADTGPGTLRDAIAMAVGSMGTDNIFFDLPIGAMNIALVTELSVTSPVIIDGRAQPGYSSAPLVTISGTFAFSQNGLVFGFGAAGSQVHALAISDFDASGIHVNAPNMLITGCTITGNFNGISVFADNVTVGGVGAAARNVISGNAGDGIVVEFASGFVVQNSYIGVDRSGVVAQGNGGSGVFVRTSTSPTIGGADKNVISGNALEGIHLVDVFNDARVQNNYVGLYANGSFDFQSRNGSAGMFLFGPANFVVGTDGMLGAPNYISNNAGAAIQLNTEGQLNNGTAVITGNVIGSAPIMMGLVPAPNGGGIVANGSGVRIGGSGAESNNIAWQAGDGIATDGRAEVRGNFFADSGDEVIDVFGDGFTQNDDSESDGAQNFPLLSGAVMDGMGAFFAIGTLHSTPNTDFTLNYYGFNFPAYTFMSAQTVTTDGDGNATFTQQVPSLTGYANIAATATDGSTGRTSEMSFLAPIAPGLGFAFTDPVTLAPLEGNAGATLLSFTVQMTTAPSGAVSVVLSARADSTATNGADYTFTPSVLNFNPTTTQQTVTVAIAGDTDVERSEFINFILSGVMGNAVLLPGTQTVTIVNDDTSLKITTDGKVATWRDVDGDLVTLKSTKGILDTTDFVMEAQGLLGGEMLQRLDLSNDGTPAKGVGLAFTAKYDKVNNRGDGAVNLGFLNAAGVDLGVVTLPGDLGSFAAGDILLTDGAIKSLTIGSMGVLDGSGLSSQVQGKLGVLIVRGDIFNARINADTTMLGNGAAGGFGSITIGGSLRGESGGPASIFATGDIGSVKIAGSIVGDTEVETSGIRALGKIGAVTIGGSVRATNPAAVSAIEAGTTLGKVTIGGDLEFGVIFALGKAQPINAAAALAIAGVTVKGRVASSSIGAGLSSDGALNPDVQIGAISVAGDWLRSSVFAGVSRGADNRFGTADDAVLTPTTGFTDKPAIVSKIASVTVKGQIYGNSNGTGSHGFVAQSIGKFIRGTTAYTLRPNATPNALPLDLVSLSLTGNVFLREVI